MWLDKENKNNSKPFGIRWPKTPNKALGLDYSYNKQSAINKKFVDKMESLLKELHWWKAGKLSLSVKNLVVKSLSLSKFALLACLISIPKKT